MRRIKILLFWLLRARNNISFAELIHFLSKPIVHRIASQYISSITKNEMYEVVFRPIPHVLYWPSAFPIQAIDQVTVETFDQQDWHFYQKEHTQISQGEILLDIGTAEGLFPLTVVEKCSKIILVEPNPHFYNALQKTFAKFAHKVQIIHSAVGNKKGSISMQGESLSGSIIENDTAHGAIPLNKIDTILPANQKITYLKADIEGFEEEMLKGAELTIKRNTPKIAITSYHLQNNANEIIRLVKSFVPDYQYYVKGIHHDTGKPVMIHFWV
jgi:FkbM family methyltransferase